MKRIEMFFAIAVFMLVCCASFQVSTYGMYIKDNIPKRCTISTPRPLTNTWIKVFDGDRDGISDDDEGYCVQQTSDGGYIVVGNKYLDGVWLIKLNENGNIVWDRVFGDLKDEHGYIRYGYIGYYVQQTNDGGYIIGGVVGIEEQEGRGDVLLLKTDGTGNILWIRNFGGKYWDEGYCVQQTKDGGYIIVGYRGYLENDEFREDTWLIKTDRNGNKMWDRTFTKYKRSEGLSVRQTTDGGYIILGNTYISYVPHAWLIKTDENGNLKWDYVFPPEYKGFCVQQTSDDGYIVVGFNVAGAEGGTSFGWLFKLDKNGKPLWERDFEEEFFKCVQQTKDGGYILTGEEEGPAILIKTDENGKKIWKRTFSVKEKSTAYHIQQTVDGGYVISGHALKRGTTPSGHSWIETDVLVIKTDGEGKVTNRRTIVSSFKAYNFGLSLQKLIKQFNHKRLN